MECEAEGGATGGMDFCFRGTTCLKNELPPELYGTLFIIVNET